MPSLPICGSHATSENMKTIMTIRDKTLQNSLENSTPSNDVTIYLKIQYVVIPFGATAELGNITDAQIQNSIVDFLSLLEILLVEAKNELNNKNEKNSCS